MNDNPACSTDSITGEIYSEPYLCDRTLPPAGKIKVIIIVYSDDPDDKKNPTKLQKRFGKINLKLTGSSGDKLVERNKSFEAIEFEVGKPVETTIEKLNSETSYSLSVVAVRKRSEKTIIQGLTYESEDLTNTENSDCSKYSCTLAPDGEVKFTITFPIRTGRDKDKEKRNDEFVKAIEEYSEGKRNALDISSLIKSIGEAPGLQTAICNPTSPAGCEYVAGDENDTSL